LAANQANRSSVDCNSLFFAIGLQPNGDLNWSSQEHFSCESIGTEVLINSANEELILGDFRSGPVIIDGTITPNPSLDNGGFVGKYLDESIDQCCLEEVDLGSNISICLNESFPVLSIAGQITEPILSIQWIYDLSVVASDVETYLTTQEGTYTVRVEYGDGCLTEDDIAVRIVDCYVECVFKPTATVTPKSPCSFQFVGSAPSGSESSIVGVLWDFGDGATSLASTVNHAYAEAGTYQAVFTVYSIDENGNCCTISVTKTVVVSRGCGDDCSLKAKINMEYVANDVYFFSAPSPTINTGAITVVGYQWTIDGVVVSTASSFAMEITGTQDICLTVFGITERGGCCEDRTCQTISRRRNKSKTSANNSLDFKAFPNPTKDVLNIDFQQNNKNLEAINIAVYDALGTKIYSSSTRNQNHQIDCSKWNDGIYFCQVTSGGLLSVQKLFKGNSFGF